MSIELTSTKLPIRTRGDGHWKKFTYQDLSWTVTLSGLLTFDDDMWTGWDMLDNQFNFSHVLGRVSFSDAEGNIRTVQGYMMIETSTLSYSPGNLVKDDFQMQGNGRLDMFDGLVPCDTLITNITVTGQTASDGIIHIDYTFTGPVYQVKYRIDDSGDFVYATAGPTIDVPGLPNANHTVEIIPVCVNSYEGVGRTARFQVMHAQTCGSSIDSITVNTTAFTIVNTHSGAATQMRYRIDGGVWLNAAIGATLSIANIDPGNHTVEEVPVCSNGVEGAGLTKVFTITVQPALAKINWSFTPAGSLTIDSFQVYVNGVLIVNTNSSSFGFFMVSIGSSVRTLVYGPSAVIPRNLNLHAFDLTTSADLYLHSTHIGILHSGTEQFTATIANSDQYQFDGSVT